MMFSWYRIPTLFAHEIFSPFRRARKRNPIWFALWRVARLGSNILWFHSSPPVRPSPYINHMKKSYNFNVIISEGEMNMATFTRRGWNTENLLFGCFHLLALFIQFYPIFLPLLISAGTFSAGQCCWTSLFISPYRWCCDTPASS